jgi:hypothetical protein
MDMRKELGDRSRHVGPNAFNLAPNASFPMIISRAKMMHFTLAAWLRSAWRFTLPYAVKQE